VFAEDII